MVNPSRKAGLGNLLNKASKQINRRKNPRKSDRHTTEIEPTQDYARLNLRSVTAQSNLDEFFEEAQLAGKQFVTERRNLAVIDENKTQIDLYDEHEKVRKEPQLNIDDIDIPGSLCVPRRPQWDSNTTPEVLDEREKLTFLTWRKKLARLQEVENLVMTPFEKNIEVWRQLWRVVERSDIVVQILDCRNPLLYICDDLIKYVDEDFHHQKMNLILLNKADFLTKEQRLMWSKYFKSRGIKSIFFSALYENENLKQMNRLDREAEPTENSPEHSDHQSESTPDVENSVERVAGQLKEVELANSIVDDDVVDETRIYNKFELLDTWHAMLKKLETSRPSRQECNGQIAEKEIDIERPDSGVSERSSHDRPLTVGLVGYPNVGKSSTINALLSAKRVAVSATPGKTKHFQTFLVDKDMMLCDCPGLVFPNFVSCKSEMIINGILPIDQMKDYVGPVRIIVNRIPRGFFEEIYGLAFDSDARQNIVAEDLLNAFGFMRGYMTARGLPDISRAARKVCKDYINGKILYCEAPPDADEKLFQSHSKLADVMQRIEERSKDPNKLRITERQSKLMRQARGIDTTAKRYNTKNFHPSTGGVHIKGLPGIGNMTQPIGSYKGEEEEDERPKREKKHKKREKLRRVYRHMDI